MLIFTKVSTENSSLAVAKHPEGGFLILKDGVVTRTSVTEGGLTPEDALDELSFQAFEFMRKAQALQRELDSLKAAS